MRLLLHFALFLTCGVGVAQSAAPAALPPGSGAQSPATPPVERRRDPPPGGMPFVHDPSTVIQDHGNYYVYTTGRGIPILSSPDKVNWTRLGSVFTQIPEQVHAVVPKNNGTDVWAPDIIKLGDTFYLYYAVSSWGSFQSAVALATNTTLDPANPSYKWVDRGVVVRSDGVEDMNDIDPGVILAPGGTLWICFGSYHGSINLLQLDPKTGLAPASHGGTQGITIARESEAADIISHDGYFYLFVNHGSCCKGKDSEYNIRVGRSRTITGPYLDKHGVALTRGGGSLFLAAHDHRIGPGHFGRVIEETVPSRTVSTNDLETFSLHYEADLTNTGRPALGIRPLLWLDDWPVAGDTLAAGTYQILSKVTEDTLLMQEPHAGDNTPAASLRLGRYRAIEAQQWSIQRTGDGFYTLVNLGTKTALGVLDSGTLTSAVPFSGAAGQLWSLDQSTDGSYRMRNHAAGTNLTRTVEGALGLSPDANGDGQRWYITSP